MKNVPLEKKGLWSSKCGKCCRHHSTLGVVTSSDTLEAWGVLQKGMQQFHSVKFTFPRLLWSWGFYFFIFPCDPYWLPVGIPNLIIVREKSHCHILWLWVKNWGFQGVYRSKGTSLFCSGWVNFPTCNVGLTIIPQSTLSQSWGKKFCKSVF